MTDFPDRHLTSTSKEILEGIYLKYYIPFFHLERNDGIECHFKGALWCHEQIQLPNGKQIGRFGILLQNENGEYDCITSRAFPNIYLIKDEYIETSKDEAVSDKATDDEPVSDNSTDILLFDAIRENKMCHTYTSIRPECIIKTCTELGTESHHDLVKVFSRDVYEKKVVLKTLKDFFTVKEEVDNDETVFKFPMDAINDTKIMF
jgi:hypothetical protein